MRDTRLTRLLLSVALVASLGLIAVDYSDGSSSMVRSARNAAGTILGGAERAVSTVTAPVGRFFASGLAGSGGGSAASLRRQLAAMRAELSAARLSRAQYGQLRRLLGEAGRGGYRVVAASVIGYGQGLQQTVTLDAGSTAGIRPQMTVIDGDGLVGQVIAVSPATCTVLLASAPSSVVGVRLAPGGQIGWVTGGGRGPSGPALLRLQVLDPAALAPGEQLVTAASVRDRPFVPGVPVGVVVSVRSRGAALTGQALVRLYTGLTALDVVGIVIAPPVRNPRFSVLPPRPKPTPTPTPTPTPSSSRSASPHAHPATAAGQGPGRHG
ncbi:MAG TPA: rod shape-determining protein MreC [Streptosporangiaceae bacterium]|nr:rod shape-determining protein MreC [Streptosporangiaceae bacterium]